MTQEAKHTELLPCPFCGGKAQKSHLFQSDDYLISCEEKCEVRPITNSSNFIESPEKAWNTRASDRLKESNAALLEALKDMRSRFYSCISDGNGELEGDKEAIDKADATIKKAEAI